MCEPRVLVVGDGNFSFSRALAQMKALAQPPTGITATSLDSQDDLLAKYGPPAEIHVADLLRLGCTVKHGVDATVLSELFPEGRSFDQIIFQHPILDIRRFEESGAGTETHAAQGAREEEAVLALVAGISVRDGYIIANRLLLLDFLLSAGELLALPDGEITLTVKDVPPYDKWDVARLEEHTDSSLVLKRTEPFDKDQYPGYETMQVQNNVPFPSAQSTSFIFGLPDAAGTEALAKSSGRSGTKNKAMQGAHKCLLCNKAFTSETDLAKHHSSRKHREAAALEVGSGCEGGACVTACWRLPLRLR